MSHHGGGYRRKHHYKGRSTQTSLLAKRCNCFSRKDDTEHRDSHETPEQKLKTSILKLGEVVNDFQTPLMQRK